MKVRFPTVPASSTLPLTRTSPSSRAPKGPSRLPSHRALLWSVGWSAPVGISILLMLPVPTLGAVAGQGISPQILHPGNWTLKNFPLNASVPGARQSGAMAYDTAAHKFVLFGGYSGGPLGDTWVFSAGTWHNLTPHLRQSPSARWYYSMTWDPVDKYVLLFGGRNSSSDFNDTWAFKGTTWTLIPTTSAPPPITSGRMVYDARDGYVVLYGGYSIMPNSPSLFNFTWTYLSGRWTNITSKVVGAPPDPHVTTYGAYDPGSQSVVFYGGDGFTGTCATPGYTWLYSKGTYTNITSRLHRAPPVLLGSRMMAYDPGFPGVVLYGGWDGWCGFSNETWVFHGGVWTQHVIAPNPGPLWDGAMACNQATRTVLLFGGAPGGSSQSSSTWTLTP